MALGVVEAFEYGVNSDEFGEALLNYIKACIYQEQGPDFRFTGDAVSEATIKVLEDIHAFDPKLSPLPVWIKVIVRNVCIDMLRNHNHSKTQAFIGNEGHNPFSTVDKLSLKQLLSGLSPEEKILVREKIAGITDSQMAEKRGVTRQAITIRLDRLKKKLRTHVGGSNGE